MRSGWKFLLPTLLVMFFMVSCDDDDDYEGYVPDTAVITAFFEMYPDATIVDWEQKLGYAVAEFNYQGRGKDAWFEKDGTWVLTETELSVAELPEGVRKTIADSEYAKWKLEDAGYLERKDMEPVYVVEAELSKQEVRLYYSVTGVFLKVVTEGTGDNQAVPTPVNENILNAVHNLYPTAKIVEIEVEPQEIKVYLVNEGIYFTMVLDKEYKWVQSDWDAVWIRVPQEVKDALKTAGYSFNELTDEVSMIVRPQNDGKEIILYRITLKQNSKEIVLYFTENGLPVT